MKIGIVECDVPMPELVNQFGDYTQYFKTLLSSSGEAATTAGIEYVTYQAYLDAPMPTRPEDLKSLDGLLFTGSKFTSYDNDPWILRTLDLIRLAYENNVRMVGICFGHQMLARALGGEVAANPKGWEVAVTSTSTFSCPLLPTLKALRLQQMHRDIVTKAPPHAQIVGSNEICEIQAMYEPGRYFSVQGHPEFNQITVETVLRNRIDRGIVPQEYGADAMQRASLPHDGLVIGAAIIDFFEQRDKK